MSVSRKPLRYAVLGLLFAAGLVFAPASFARGHHGHWNVSLNFGFPGVAVGYSNYGWGGGYGGYYGGYTSYYSPAYYGYGPAYYGYSAPVVYRSAYYDRPYYRSYRSHGSYDRGYSYGRDRGYRDDRGYRRASYYDRGYR